ncbi:MAG: GntR family transcriptional regulator [Kiritimatiellae bacterium]|nr:GntR family transcriptional regulator [Kiritimatiellia bacterium]
MVQRNIPFSVSRNDGRPLVAQVADGLRQAIVAGFYRPGDVVPPSRDLAPKLGVSRIVTKAALAQLSAEGLVVARPRIGTVVRDRNVKQWKGRVIFACPEGDENYAQTVLAGTLRNRLTEAGYLFTQVCLPQKARDRYDFARLDAALSQSADMIVTMFARPHILSRLSRQKVPFAVFGEYAKAPRPAVGGTWLNFNLAAGEFAAACKANGIRNVVEFCYCAMCDVAPALRKVGIGIKKIQVPPNRLDSSLINVKRMGMEIFGRLIAKKQISRDTVYFFADDYLASGALTALSYAGLRSPEDVRIVTFANKRLGPAYPRELSRMEFDAHKAGDVLADAVLECLKGGKYPSGSVVGPVWVAGETMGAPLWIQGKAKSAKAKGGRKR